MKRSLIFTAISDERARQEAKFPGKTAAHGISAYVKAAILTEECGEVSRALLDRESDDRLRKELVQVAAVCVAWLEALT